MARSIHLAGVREQGGGLSILVRSFDRPMGLAMRYGRMALGCRNEVWEFLKTLLVGHYGSEHVWID